MERRPIILLVDESEFFLGIERQFLRHSQVRVLTLQSVDSVESTVRQARPDLIYMDRFAPEMVGARCCACLKADPELGHIPLVLLVSGKNEREREICLKAGCDGLLTKPIDRSAFLAMGRRFLPAIDRRERRVLCHTTVFFRSVHGSGYGHTVDISAGGVFIETDHPAQRGDRLSLSFHLPGDASGLIEVEGRVVWVNTAENPVRSSFPAGFGVEFIASGPLVQRWIRDYVESHAPHQERVREGQVLNDWQPFLPLTDPPAAG
ncbi:uncharacterized protein (TIGR02266 family) [Geothermobacter ehrlichii]|uniref:Uncharacterized protein (TIGR02266 family) n=1 Tax=Geothermobacter ehrlichii TaxID=213224 RepID=A0A5D3WMS4_9BACT|nr:PilZ domain-containing protein [Geothermobacter ehrlichii]TYO99666.1 uncharacterized protein (TIGR02266 family) [Geothermobacter ehrlichii]